MDLLCRTEQGQILGIRCVAQASERRRYGPTDGRTDGRTDPPIEMLGRIEKRWLKILFHFLLLTQTNVIRKNALISVWQCFRLGLN